MISKLTGHTDIPFFISKNKFTEDFNIIKEMSAIRQSVKNLILTNKGERFFDADIGSDVYASMFENFDIETIITLQSRIANNLNIYEPRVIVNDVRVLEEPKEYAIKVIVDIGLIGTNIKDSIEINLVRNR